MNLDKKEKIRNLIKENKFFIDLEVYKKPKNKDLKEVIEILNNDKKVIISGIDFVWKTDLVRFLIEKTNIKDKVLYFNKRLDYENIIRNYKDLKEYIKLYTNSKTKFIILQNIWNIKNIKNFLWEILNSDYKIIFIWNDIKINSIKEKEIKVYTWTNIKNELKFWKIWFLSQLSDIKLQKQNISLIKDKIILDNIFNLKSVKDISLYYSIINFISKKDSFESIRELHSIFSKRRNLSIRTFTDYLDFSEQSKLIQKVNLYDLKREKEISTKTKYFFLDNWILNSFNHFRQSEEILIKNLIFIYLNWYKIQTFWWRFWNFMFDFYIKWKNNETYIIKLSSLENYKKDLIKFKKIDATKKFIIIEDLACSNIRKKDFWDLQIIDLVDFFEVKF